jgi:aminopeptidase N
LKVGVNEVELSFESPVSAAGSAVTRYQDREDGSEYVYTLFVPSDASTMFPCFDQPDLKARFQLRVTAPEQW